MKTTWEIRIDLPLDQHEEVQQRRLPRDPTNRSAGRGDRGDKELMLKSAKGDYHKEKLKKKRTCKSSREATTTTKQEEQEDNSRESLGSRGISTTEQRIS
jgi:hypothetical protein